jgi:hypothetical protein
VPPSGLSKDGASTVYERFVVRAGDHELAVKLSDSVRVTGFNYTKEQRVRLDPGRILIVDFNAEKGGILIQ